MGFCSLAFFHLVLIASICKVLALEWPENCILPKEDCHIENQASLGAYYESAFTYVGTKYEKVLILDVKTAKGSAARLITPFVDGRRSRSICITLEYLMEGEGISQLTVVQHGPEGGRKIYDVGSDKKGKWILALMDVEQLQGMHRYLIESRLYNGKDGAVLIRNFSYAGGKCKQPDQKTSWRKRRQRLRNFGLA